MLNLLSPGADTYTQGCVLDFLASAVHHEPLRSVLLQAGELVSCRRQACQDYLVGVPAECLPKAAGWLLGPMAPSPLRSSENRHVPIHGPPCAGLVQQLGRIIGPSAAGLPLTWHYQLTGVVLTLMVAEPE